ncbi:MAG: putative metal-dependent hydrolase [Myxococcota bacterium]|jgi:predicted metal-dependent hydrolase
MPTPEPDPFRARRLAFDFDPQVVPVHWNGGNVVASHAVNGMNLVFPDGERFFIRSVRRYLHRIDDPSLKARARVFFQQEAQHGHAHEQAFEMLEGQGFEVASWLAWYRQLAFRRIEPFAPAMLSLAVTAAMEHLTAALGHETLAEGTMDAAHPVMRDLLRWHSAEEIEHKSVAFDVLTAVGGGWGMRVVGMTLGLFFFLVFWQSATRHLTRQDPELQRDPGRWRRDKRELHARLGDTRLRLFRFALGYLRPGFHPDDIDDYPLAQAALVELAPLEV